MAELGTTGAGGVASLDAAGTLEILGGRPRVDWWVGAEDRWHRASTDAAVRQGLGEDQSTPETRMRVPGGDMVQRVGVVPDGDGATIVVEVENETPVPVAVAVVVQTHREAEVVDDTLRAGDHVLVRAGRSIARVLGAPDMEALGRGVEAGDAMPPAELDQPLPPGHVALIFPVPHTAILRCAIAADDQARGAAPQDLPPVEAVARGWEAHLERGASILVPDERLTRALAAARRHLLVGSGKAIDHPFWSNLDGAVAPVAAAALDAWGHHVEARELLLAAIGTDDLAVNAARGTSEAGALVWAWAERLERRPDPELEAALVPWIEDVAIGLLGRRRRRWFGPNDGPAEDAWRAVGLAAAGSLLTRWGNTTLGPDIMDALPDLLADVADGSETLAYALGGARLGDPARRSVAAHLATLLEVDAASLAGLAARADALGALGMDGRNQHPAASALLLLATRRAVADEPAGSGGPVALLSAPDPGWLGAPLEAHRLPVTAGTVSFGARWHGERPALLWDLQGDRGVVSVTAPGLDASWGSDDPRGEALLRPTAGLQVETGPESPQVQRGEALDLDDEPDSFS